MFRSFLPLHNLIGFGASDYVELAVAGLLVGLVLVDTRLAERLRRLAIHTRLCMLLLAILPVVLRLALLPQSPVPTPSGADDFAHLLVADTLLHFRLANAPHPLNQFFETVFVLQEPTYSSIFPIGQGLALAVGRLLFGHPWAGVVLSVALLCALCYWMLLAWVTPGWALIGALLAVLQFGPLRYWMNTYWGGTVAAIAGCLVFGALPRLRADGRARDAALLGAGLGIELLARPFESLLLLAAVALYLPAIRNRLLKAAPIVLAAALPAVALTLLQNKQVTGSWATLPYTLSQYQYGVPATFTFQRDVAPHRQLTPAQQLDYDAQVAAHDKSGSYLDRMSIRARLYRFYFLAPLYIALPFFLLSLREFRFAWVTLTLVIFAVGTNFYPYFYPHYIAALACLFVLMSVVGLERLSRLTVRGHPAGREAAAMILILCAAQFIFWYGFHLFADTNESIAMRQYETWDFVNHGDPDGRIAVKARLAQAPGKQLVLVRYWPRHLFDEWVRNTAAIDQARVVWALDLGAAEDEKLLRYYSDRTPWLLEPDARPPQLTPYRPQSSIP